MINLAFFSYLKYTTTIHRRVTCHIPAPERWIYCFAFVSSFFALFLAVVFLAAGFLAVVFFAAAFFLGEVGLALAALGLDALAVVVFFLAAVVAGFFLVAVVFFAAVAGCDDRVMLDHIIHTFN